VKRGKLIIGTAPSSSSVIKASKDLTRKAVFCVSNLVSDVTCDNLGVFITSLGVQVLSCFDAKTKFTKY